MPKPNQHSSSKKQSVVPTLYGAAAPVATGRRALGRTFPMRIERPGAPAEEGRDASDLRPTAGLRSEPSPPVPSAEASAPGVVLAAAEPPRLDARQNQEATAERVGRFIVVGRLGRGAMGVVHKAYDADLDRMVAIKVVDGTQFGSMVGDARALLEREAKAAASLSHPNVVSVYEVGKHQGEMFVAMEYVDGDTLEGWAQPGERSWREVLEMYISAGRGLAAAHAAGIVHRDFKPENVLVGRDNRPRVADFGLARPTAGWSAREAAQAVASGGGISRKMLSAGALASTGTICGTPAYMAPEQYSGLEVGPAADQFAFCVSVFEGLFGYRPFSGETITELAANVIEGRAESAPTNSKVPGTVVRALSRGLSQQPGDRFASLEPLLAVLERALGRRRRRTLVAVLSGTVAVAMLGAFGATAAAQSDPCAGVEDDLTAAWGETRRDAVATSLGAMASTMRSDALLGALDGYGEDWRSARIDACEAEKVRHEDTEFVSQLRVACLDRAAARMEGITLALGSSGSMMSRDAEIPGLLIPVEDCSDAEELQRASDWYAVGSLSPEQVEARANADRLLAQADLGRTVGRDGWQDFAKKVVEIGEEHDFKTLQSLGLARLGDHALDVHDAEQARAHFEAAVRLAIAANHDHFAALYTARLADAVLAGGDTSEASVHLSYARMLAERVRDDDTQMEIIATADVISARIHLRDGNYAEAKEILEPGVEMISTASWARLDLKSTWMSSLARTHKELGEYRQASRSGEAAWEFHRLAGDHQSAMLARVRHDLGNYATLRQDFDRAEVHFGAATAMLQDVLGHDSIEAGTALGNQGWMERERGRTDVALAHLTGARERLEAGGDAGQSSLPFVLEELAEVHIARSEYDEALGLLNRAGQMRDQVFGAGHPGVGFTLTAMGRALLAKGEPAKALGPLEAALEIRSKAGAGMDPIDLAETEAVMVQALAKSDPDRARALATSAIDRLPEVPWTATEREELRTWLAAENDRRL